MYFNHTNTLFKLTPFTLTLLATGLLPSASVLAESATESHMETMFVTASKTEHSELEAPASISVITSEELEKLAISDIAEAISTLPGIHLNQGTAYGRNEIKIRGLDSDYTLILVNGRRLSSHDALSSTNGNDFDLSSIPMSAIERIEVVSGPMSSLYGADALGGVVNVILKKADEETHASVGYLYENITEGSGGDTHKINASVNGALIENKLLGSVYIDKSGRDVWESEFNDVGSTLEGREELNIATNLTWLVNDNQEVDIDLRYNQDHRDSDYSYYGTAYSVEQDLERVNFSTIHSGYWESFDSRLSYNIDHIDLMNDSELNGEVADIFQINQIFNAQLSKTIGENVITGGAEFSITSLENNLTLDDTVSYNTSAFYLQDEIEFGKLAVTVSGRLDNHEVYGNEFSPRLYGVYSLTDNWVLKGGVGKAFNAPTLAQYDGDYAVLSCRGSCYEYGNADLEAETAISHELSMSYQAENVGGSVTLFKNNIENMIAYDRSDLVYSGYTYVSGNVTYENIDEAVLQGVELSLWYDLTDTISLSGNYTYTDAEDKTDETELVQTPEHVASASVSWQARDNLSTSISYQYTGEQYVSSVSDGNLSNAYRLINVAMQYAPIKDVNIKAGITNLFNEERDDIAEAYYYALQSRSIYAGITYDF